MPIMCVLIMKQGGWRQLTVTSPLNSVQNLSTIIFKAHLLAFLFVFLGKKLQFEVSRKRFPPSVYQLISSLNVSVQHCRTKLQVKPQRFVFCQANGMTQEGWQVGQLVLHFWSRLQQISTNCFALEVCTDIPFGPECESSSSTSSSKL